MRYSIFSIILYLGIAGCSSIPVEGSSAATVLANRDAGVLKALPDFDMTEMLAQQTSRRQLRQPVIEWYTLNDGFKRCPITPTSSDLLMPGQGCVVVKKAENKCHVYTASRTTHSIMGHLFKHCFEGGQ